MIRIWKSFSGKKHPQNRRKQNLRTRRQDAPPTSETWHNRWLESETSLGFKQPAPQRNARRSPSGRRSTQSGRPVSVTSVYRKLQTWLRSVTLKTKGDIHSSD